MKIIVLDGYALSPGDLSWDGLKELGDLTIYDRTPPEQVVERLQGAEALTGPWYDLGVSSPVTLPTNTSLRVFRLICD